MGYNFPLPELTADYKPDPPENPCPHYLELKTCGELLTPGAIWTFEHKKLLKFWAQSFLLGVPKIIVGFRSKDNTLASIETLDTMKVPAQVRERGEHVWDGNVCINFGLKFLEFLKVLITEDSKVYGIRLMNGDDKIAAFEKGGKSFLTDEYVDWKLKMISGAGEGTI